MRAVLEFVLITGAAAVASCVLIVAWVRHRLRRRLRISPAVRSLAPTIWLVSPTATARLHQRLRRVAASGRTASVLDPALRELTDELVADALALEPAVVAVAGTGRARMTVRRDLSARITELELVARQLTALSAQRAGEPRAAVRLRDRVDALAAARQELADIEHAVGLRSRA